MAESRAMHPTLVQAVRLIKEGDKPEGRRLLSELLRADPHNESAWLWMVNAVEGVAQRIYCLEQVLRINPGNEPARQVLGQLKPSMARAEPEATPAEEQPEAGSESRAEVTLQPGVDPDNVSRLLKTLSSL